VTRRRSSIHAAQWLAGALLALPGCDWTEPKVSKTDEVSAKAKQDNARRLKRACASSETYDRLKALTFDEVMKVRSGTPEFLDRLAANTTIRMEDPVAKSRDEQLDVTVCEGHLVMHLPPGVQDAFDGNRQLEADVEYSAQQAVDGSGLVYQMKGAEPIIYRLAALTLPKGSAPAPIPAPASASAGLIPSTTPAPPLAPVQPTPSATEAVIARAPVVPKVPEPLSKRHRSASRSSPEQNARALSPIGRVSPSSRVASAQAVGASRPSFNCGRVTSRVLRMVCSDPDLAARDRRMSSVFYAALANSDDQTRAELRASRDRFLSYRGRCSTPACIAQAYDDRVAEIRDIAHGR
jgi:hypothetical protein